MKRFLSILVLCLSLSSVAHARAGMVIVETIRSPIQQRVENAREQHAQNQEQRPEAPERAAPSVVEQLLRSLWEMVDLRGWA